MGVEIERKFLVADPAAAFAAESGSERIAQGYLSPDPAATVRVRLRGDHGYLTVKSPNRGAERGEWEYEIPASDARELLELSRTPVLDKTRHLVRHAGHTWEVDEFHGALSGLVLAEVELSSPYDAVALPPWLGREVTGDPAYYNSSLARRVADGGSAETDCRSRV